ncbi:arsenic resistance protein [Nesterenkonia flava]|uniref:Arsenic resistance protein n=1 Tax=Nesterenkonia flava TaxID=469799 RepID=A0ABU1FWL3_9MICC|nr:arsenic resistance protein [Nesterenkonia flava]MDR5712712.1 arsenic resistance protein [Nesterenkonia flava]
MSRVERLQSVFVAVAALGGLGLGLILPGAHYAEGAVLPLLLVMLTAVFLQMEASGVGAVRRARGLVLLSLVLNFVVTPALAFALGAGLLGEEPDLRIGLLLLLVTPCTDWYLVFTAAARGHTGIAAALLPLNLVLQLVLLPVYVLLLGGEAATVDVGTLLGAVGLVLLVPLGVAALVRWTAAHRPSGVFGGGLRRLQEVAGAVVVPLLCLAVAAMFASQADTVLAQWDAVVLLLPALLIFFTLLPLLSAGAGHVAGLPASHRVTLIMTTTARNSPIALGIAVAAFPDRPLIAVALVLGPLLELPLLALIAQLVRVPEAR